MKDKQKLGKLGENVVNIRQIKPKVLSTGGTTDPIFTSYMQPKDF